MSGATPRLAWWLLRGGLRRGALLLACLAVGIAARVCVGSLLDQVAWAMARDSRQLLGGDVDVAGNRELTSDERDRFLAAVAATAHSRTIACNTSAVVTSSDGPRGTPVSLLVVEQNWPLAGGLQLRQAGTERETLAVLHMDQPSCLIASELADLWQLDAGSHLKLGKMSFTVAGVMREEPGQAAAFGFGPRVVIGQRHFPSTGLGNFGARLRHALQATIPDPRNAEDAAMAARTALGLERDGREKLQQGFAPETGLVVRSPADAQESLKRGFERFGDFLRLVSLCALLLAALGVASLSANRLHQLRPHLATLRAIGASTSTLAIVTLAQAVVWGIVGGLGGAALGVGLANAAAVVMQHVPSEALVVKPAFGIAWAQAGIGIALGVLVTLAACAATIVVVARLHPLEVIRGPSSAKPGWLWQVALWLLALGLLWVVASAEARSWLIGLRFAGVLAGAGLLIAATGACLLPLVARLGRRLGSFTLRHGLANLHRPGPGHRPLAALLALAVGALLFAVLTCWQASLVAEFAPSATEQAKRERPALFVIDIQPDQEADVKTLLAEQQITDAAFSPIVLGRLRGIDAAAQAAPGSREAEERTFFINREQRLSWRNQPDDGDRIVAGQWMDTSRSEGAVEASLEQRWAARLGIGLGDTLRFEVQGRSISATVTSLRTVDWSRMRPAFFVLLSPHALQGSAQIIIASVPKTDAATQRRVHVALIERWGLTVFDLVALGERIAWLLDKLLLGIQMVGLFPLVAGLLAVAGLALGAAAQRRGEVALLRALGASKRQVLLSLLAEYAALALLAVLLGTGLGVASTALLLHLGDISLAVNWPHLLGWAGALAAAATGCGVLASWPLLRVAPLQVLRED